MIVLAVAPEHFERMGRAIATLLQPRAQELEVSLDVVPYDPRGEKGQWGGNLGLKPAYERSVHAGPLAESSLERILQEEPRDMAWLARFHKLLLESEVLVPVKIEGHEARRTTIPADSDLSVITLSRTDGVDVIAFF